MTETENGLALLYAHIEGELQIESISHWGKIPLL